MMLGTKVQILNQMTLRRGAEGPEAEDLNLDGVIANMGDRPDFI